MSIHSKIKAGRLQLGESEEVFGRRFDVTRGTVQQWEREGGTAPKRERLTKVASAIGLTINQLMEDSSNVEDGPTIQRNRSYPVISEVQAGVWTDISDNFSPGDAEEWRDSHKDLGLHGYVLRVAGDSMTGAPGAEYTFPSGYLLFVNPDLDPLPGKFVIVRRESEKAASFKRLVQVDGELFLEALNPSWPNRYLKLKEGDAFCGVVVHAGRDLP
jgi:SOS-response transcriptional repressor LexA